MRTYARGRGALAVAAVTPVLLIAGCSSPGDDGVTGVRPPPVMPTVTRATPAPAATPTPTATSAADLGGMAALVTAAKREGRLEVTAPLPERANYGEIIKAFTAAYEIKVSLDLPAGSSQDEIDVVNQLKGSGRREGDGPAPDVLDLGMPVALASTSLFAPYRVETWNDIPERQKDPTGLWFQDHGGLLSIGYDSAEVPDVTSVSDLLDPAYRNKVALSGDPTRSDAAFYAVQMVSLAIGGSLDDIGDGMYFFTHLVAAGNFVPVHATTETVKSGKTPVVLDWDYRSAAHVAEVPTWKVFVPENAALVAYRAQAISKHAPHPAAARLWVEFLASDEGQHLRAKGGAQPVRTIPMTTARSRGQATAGALPRISGTPAFLSQEQLMKAKATLDYGWPKAMAIGVKAGTG